MRWSWSLFRGSWYMVKREMLEITQPLQDRLEFIKNPVVAEFLGMSQNTDFTETKLETAILNNIQRFLMELGKGYAFVARQQHIHTLFHRSGLLQFHPEMLRAGGLENLEDNTSGCGADGYVHSYV